MLMQSILSATYELYFGLIAYCFLLLFWCSYKSYAVLSRLTPLSRRMRALWMSSFLTTSANTALFAYTFNLKPSSHATLRRVSSVWRLISLLACTTSILRSNWIYNVLPSTSVHRLTTERLAVAALFLITSPSSCCAFFNIVLYMAPVTFSYHSG